MTQKKMYVRTSQQSDYLGDFRTYMLMLTTVLKYSAVSDFPKALCTGNDFSRSSHTCKELIL